MLAVRVGLVAPFFDTHTHTLNFCIKLQISSGARARGYRGLAQPGAGHLYARWCVCVLCVRRTAQHRIGASSLVVVVARRTSRSTQSIHVISHGCLELRTNGGRTANGDGSGGSGGGWHVYAYTHTSGNGANAVLLGCFSPLPAAACTQT